MDTPVALHLATRLLQIQAELRLGLEAPDDDLTRCALAIARIEYPALDPDPYLRRLDIMGGEAAGRIEGASPGRPQDVVRAFGEYLYDEQGFRGNREQYDDPRNSFLNEVLDRRTGIPIALATVYVEVARRAGLQADGINFPGHFLVRVGPTTTATAEDFLVVDPFHGGALLTPDDCRDLLRVHVGPAQPFADALLAPASRRQIVLRTLANLKRLYVRMRSFPQAHLIVSLMVGIEPLLVTELRDRGLLAYHLGDHPAALRDLDAYLQLRTSPVLVGARAEAQPDAAADDRPTEDEEDEDTQLQEQVRMLRRRVSTLN